MEKKGLEILEQQREVRRQRIEEVSKDKEELKEMEAVLKEGMKEHRRSLTRQESKVNQAVKEIKKGAKDNFKMQDMQNNSNSNGAHKSYVNMAQKLMAEFDDEFGDDDGNHAPLYKEQSAGALLDNMQFEWDKDSSSESSSRHQPPKNGFGFRNPFAKPKHEPHG